MIVKEQKQSEILTDGGSQESIAMSLDLDSAQFLMQMLSKNLYSDAIGSTIRETCSNALDSHRRAGVVKPIIVKLGPVSNSAYEFSVEDFGTGLDDADVEDIISKYGKSTKRDKEDELGLMGLGFKAPLAYTSSFYFITRKDGIERKYMMYEGEEVNSIDLLHESQTKEKNGVKVVVPVKYEDRRYFYDKMKEQLAYFEHVYFDVNIVNYWNGTTINNDFKIYRHDHFQISELVENKSMHLCLDNVYYPIDYDKLGIPEIKVPIALKFSLNDGIYPTPNRETIRYTPEAKAIIINKIRKVADSLIDEYNKSISQEINIFSIANYYRDNSRYVTLIGKSYEISDFVKYGSRKFNIPSIPGTDKINVQNILQKDSILFGEYIVKYRLINDRFNEAKDYRRIVSFDKFKNKHIYIFSDRIGVNKKDYIKEIHPSNNSHDEKVMLIKKSSPYKLFPKKKTYLEEPKSYYEILGLRKIPRSEWRETIKQFQYLQSLVMEKAIDLDELVIPESWLIARKVMKGTSVSASGKVIRRAKLEGEITCKEGDRLERYVAGKNCKFVSATYKLEDIGKQPLFMIYSKHDDADRMNSLYGILNTGAKIGTTVKIVTFSDRELKIIKDAEIHNLVSYEEFMTGKYKVFRRAVSSYLIHKLISKNSSSFRKRDVISTISHDLSSKMDTLVAYAQKYYRGEDGLNPVYESMLEIAKDNNLYDEDIHDVYVYLRDLFDKFYFINVICSRMTYNDKDIDDVLTDMFKYYKFRLNYTRYKRTNKEEEKEEVDQLVNNI